MLITTTEQIPGYQTVEVKGAVFGVIGRSRGMYGNVMAGLRTIFGGEIREYTELLKVPVTTPSSACSSEPRPWVQTRWS